MIMARFLPRSPNNNIFQNQWFSRNSTTSSANRAIFDDTYQQYSQLLQSIHRSQSSPGSVGFTSRDKRNFSHNLHASFSSNTRTNLSIEEIACDEIDDILPKTDYTYVRTASYSPKYSRETKYISPNMSRRRIHRSQPAFLSDDEDDLTEETPYLNIVTDSKLYKISEPEREPSESGSTKSKSSGRRRRTIVTSTPRTPQVHHISAHDHYYNGMLLRSGSHIKGVQSYLNEKETHVMMEKDKTKDSKDHLNTAVTRRSRNQRHSVDSISNPRLYESGTSMDVDTRSQRMNAHNLMTTITTTTTTTTYKENKKALEPEEFSEKKLRLDQKQTEKQDNRFDNFQSEKLGHSTVMSKVEKGHGQHDKSKTENITSQFNRIDINEGEEILKSSRKAKRQYKLRHLFGLDFDEDISDEDGLDLTDYHKSSTKSTHDQQKSKNSKSTLRSQNAALNKQRSFDTDSQAQSQVNRCSTPSQGWGSSLYCWMTTFLASVRTAISTSTLDADIISGIHSASNVLLKPASVSARWFMQWMASVATWLVTKSTTILLWDIEIKQRRRRGCCCFFLPLLFLLPLFLLGGYYTQDIYQNAGSYLSNGKQILSSSWSYLWVSTNADTKTSYIEVPPSITPVIQAEAPQINMTHIYQYIQQTVLQAAAFNKEDRPVGLTHEQVERIVGNLLAKHVDGLKANLEERIKALKVLIVKDGSSLSSLEGIITGMTEEIKATVQAHKTISLNMEQLKESIGSTNQKNTLEWQAAYEAQQLKLLDLTQQISSLSSQNAALTAMLTNCCRNNSLLADNIRAQTIAILSQMGTEDYDQLAGLFAWANEKFVERSEMDQKLDVLYTQIMDNLKVALLNIEQSHNIKSDTESHATAIAGVDESIVKNIIEDALIQFSADRVGMPDFALESAGGSVLSVRCSETFYKKTALVSVFGIPLWYTSNSPRTVIQPNVHPGECWAFKGDSGYLVLQLSYPIQVTGFTLEHIPRSLAPRGDISSAPRDFAVFGLASESDHLGVNLGNYTYEDNGKPIQFFSIQNHKTGIFQHIELRVLTNHGNKEYTCIYRFRVHGLP